MLSRIEVFVAKSETTLEREGKKKKKECSVLSVTVITIELH